MARGRALARAEPVPSLIVPIRGRSDPALPGFLGIQLLTKYLPQKRDYRAITARRARSGFT